MPSGGEATSGFFEASKNPYRRKAAPIKSFVIHDSYERGSNENLNGLFRRYFPKGVDFDTISDEEIGRVEYLINTRPRKRFNGLNPFEMFYKLTGVALDS